MFNLDLVLALEPPFPLLQQEEQKSHGDQFQKQLQRVFFTQNRGVNDNHLLNNIIWVQS